MVLRSGGDNAEVRPISDAGPIGHGPDCETRASRLVPTRGGGGDVLRPRSGGRTSSLLEVMDFGVGGSERRKPAASVFSGPLFSGRPSGLLYPGGRRKAIAAVEDLPEGSRSGAAAGAEALFERIASLSVPTVAAIHGTCLGGTPS